MDMEKEQINLLKRRRTSRWDNVRLRPTRRNLNYLKKFFLTQKKLTFFVVFSLFIQGILEIFLIVASHRYLGGNADIYSLIGNKNLIIFIFLGILIYLIASFLAIKSERTIVIRLINDLRLKWFKLSLAKPTGELSLEQHGSLLAKISYHLPLLASGLSNSLASLIRWLVLIFIFIFLSIIFGLKFLWLALAAIVFSFLIGAGGFLVSRNYVIKETTFYSQIIKTVDFSLTDWHFTKTFNREKEAIKDFTELVNFDSYFRVWRDLWLRFSASIVFIILILLSWLVSFYNQQIINFLSVNSSSSFILIIFLIYFSRLLYESLRIGLYSIPFTFGLALSVPRKNPKTLKQLIIPNFKEITFKCSKIKLFKKANYYKDLNFNFLVGGRYLISAAARHGKSILAKSLTGDGRYARRAWIIKADQKRFFYNDFFRCYSGFYYLDPKFTSDRTILEVVLGKEKSRIKEEEFTKLLDLINSHEELKGIFFEKEDLRIRSSKLTTNAKSILLLQIIYCLINKPLLISIDNYWLDYNDKEIDALLSILDKELPTSILVFFATGKRDFLSYNHSYEI